MSGVRRFLIQQQISGADVVRLAVAALIVKVTISVIGNYVDYLPPNFESSFLLGRDGYFFGSYSIAFYVHIVTGPTSLMLAVLLMSQRFRRRYRGWHARLGRVQVAIVLLVSISGLWMSRHADTGAIAGVGFALLAVATGVFVVLGLRSAKRRRFDQHQRWMSRCVLCLCSAVVLRLIAGLSIVTGIEGNWVYPLSAWISWLIPLALYETQLRFRQDRGLGQ
jgi:uncharacterized membrane protein YozB (DUF420 family)